MSHQTEMTPEQLAAEVKEEFKKSHDAVKEIAEKAMAEATRGNKLAESFKEKADEALSKLGSLQEQVSAFEQKSVRGGGDAEKAKSFGERYVDSEAFKSFQANGFSKNDKGASLSLKATLTTATSDAAGSVGDGVPRTRVPGIMELPQRRMTIRDLLTPGRMDGNTIEYVKETGFTNGAGMVAEGAAKPESDIELDLMTASAKVVAHWFKASKQALDDVSQLRSMIDARLLYGLALREEAQLLYGDGTGSNLAGLIPQASAYAAAFTPASESAIDKLRLAALQSALAEYPATGFVMHPTDWARIELTKDSTGRYIIGNPQGTLAPTVWNLPVVATQSISIDKFLTGAFQMGAQLFDRWDARIEVGYVNDDFTKNLVTILGEERITLATYRPEAFVFGDLGYVA